MALRSCPNFDVCPKEVKRYCTVSILITQNNTLIVLHCAVDTHSSTIIAAYCKQTRLLLQSGLTCLPTKIHLIVLTRQFMHVCPWQGTKVVHHSLANSTEMCILGSSQQKSLGSCKQSKTVENSLNLVLP